MRPPTILSNGSKFAGSSPDGLDVLIERLKTETLDPTFEEYGNFVGPGRDGGTRFHGNFWSYSHVFDVTVYDEETAREIDRLIRENQQTSAYHEAKDAKDAWRLKRETNRRRRLR